MKVELMVAMMAEKAEQMVVMMVDCLDERMAV